MTGMFLAAVTSAARTIIKHWSLCGKARLAGQFLALYELTQVLIVLDRYGFAIFGNVVDVRKIRVSPRK